MFVFELSKDVRQLNFSNSKVMRLSLGEQKVYLIVESGR